MPKIFILHLRSKITNQLLQHVRKLLINYASLTSQGSMSWLILIAYSSDVSHCLLLVSDVEIFPTDDNALVMTITCNGQIFVCNYIGSDRHFTPTDNDYTAFFNRRARCLWKFCLYPDLSLIKYLVLNPQFCVTTVMLWHPQSNFCHGNRSTKFLQPGENAFWYVNPHEAEILLLRKSMANKL